MLTINTKELKTAVSMAKKIADRGRHVSATIGAGWVTFVDLPPRGNYTKTALELKIKTEGAIEGAAGIDLRALDAVLKGRNPNTTITPDQGGFLIRCGAAAVSATGAEHWSEESSGSVARLEARDIKAIAVLEKVAPKNNPKFELNGVRIGGPERPYIAATDTKQMWRVAYSGALRQIIIPKKIAALLGDMVPDGCTIEQTIGGDSRLVAVGDGIKLYFDEINGVYPDAERHFQSADYWPCKATIDGGIIKEAARAFGRHDFARLDFDRGELHKATIDGVAYRAEMPADGNLKGIIALNPGFLAPVFECGAVIVAASPDCATIAFYANAGGIAWEGVAMPIIEDPQHKIKKPEEAPKEEEPRFYAPAITHSAPVPAEDKTEAITTAKARISEGLQEAAGGIVAAKLSADSGDFIGGAESIREAGAALIRAHAETVAADQIANARFTRADFDTVAAWLKTGQTDAGPISQDRLTRLRWMFDAAGQNYETGSSRLQAARDLLAQCKTAKQIENALKRASRAVEADQRALDKIEGIIWQPVSDKSTAPEIDRMIRSMAVWAKAKMIEEAKEGQKAQTALLIAKEVFAGQKSADELAAAIAA